MREGDGVERGAPAATAPEPNLRLFTRDDLVVRDLSFDVGVRDAVSRFGRPQRQEERKLEPYGDLYRILHYDGLELWFWVDGDDDFLSFAVIESPAYTGPRGLRVGDGLDAVVAAFAGEDVTAARVGRDLVYYAAEVGDGYVLPPYGRLEKDGKGRDFAVFAYPAEPYEGLTEHTMADYMHFEHAEAAFEIERGKVTAIELSLGSLSED